MGDKVVFYQYEFKKDTDKASGSISWDGRKMSAVGTVPQRILDELTESGVKDPVSKKPLFPKDGVKFLSALKYRYDNPYLRASDVITT